jgi:hypothetical protein
MSVVHSTGLEVLNNYAPVNFTGCETSGILNFISLSALSGQATSIMGPKQIQDSVRRSAIHTPRTFYIHLYSLD